MSSWRLRRASGAVLHIGLEKRNKQKLRGWKRVKAWCRNTRDQIKGQHKFVRIFFHKYDIGEDPSNKPTGAQKATVVFSIICFRM